MFITSQLNIIHKIIKNQSISTSVVDQLEQSYVNLEATLLRAKVLRDFSKTQIVYLIQSHIEPQQSSLAFLFPLLFCVGSGCCVFLKDLSVSVALLK